VDLFNNPPKPTRGMYYMERTNAAGSTIDASYHQLIWKLTYRTTILEFSYQEAQFNKTTLTLEYDFTENAK